MSSCLIMHHVEPTWDAGLRKFGTSFEEVCENIMYHLSNNNYDKIILTRFEHHNTNDSEWASMFDSGLAAYVDSVEEYAYGWCHENFEDTKQVGTHKIHKDIKIVNIRGYLHMFCEGGNHSEIVLIEDWMLELKDFEKVDICGAFDGECIEDLEIALSAVDIDFFRLENLIIG